MSLQIVRGRMIEGDEWSDDSVLSDIPPDVQSTSSSEQHPVKVNNVKVKVKRTTRKRKSKVLLGRTSCPLCRKSLTYNAVTAHVQRMHHEPEDVLYRCERFIGDCDATFLTISDRHRHYVSVHGYEPETRPAPPVDPMTRRAVRRMFKPQVFSMNEKRRCYTCKTSCTNREAYLRHKKTCCGLAQESHGDDNTSQQPVESHRRCNGSADEARESETTASPQPVASHRRRSSIQRRLERRRSEMWAAEGHMVPPPRLAARVPETVGDDDAANAAEGRCVVAKSLKARKTFIEELRDDPVLSIYAQEVEMSAMSPFSQLASFEEPAYRVLQNPGSAVAKRLFE